MSYAIFHAEKGKSSGTTLGYHIDRTDGQEHTYSHADPMRKKQNVDFTAKEFKGKKLSECIGQRIKEGYKGKKEVRKDAVKYISMVFTSDTEGMKNISSKEQMKAWIGANYEFACKEFGKENIVRFVLHRDEKTPHLHCVVVPLTKDGRLSAKEIFGNREALQQRQDRYAEMMKVFSLERGVKGSRAVHDGVVEYQTRVNEGLAKKDKINSLPSVSIKLPEPYQISEPPLLNRKEWAQEQNKAYREDFKNSVGKVQEEMQKAFKTHLNEFYNAYLATHESLEQMKKGKEETLRKREAKFVEAKRKLEEKYGVKIEPKKGNNFGV